MRSGGEARAGAVAALAGAGAVLAAASWLRVPGELYLGVVLAATAVAATAAWRTGSRWAMGAAAVLGLPVAIFLGIGANTHVALRAAAVEGVDRGAPALDALARSLAREASLARRTAEAVLAAGTVRPTPGAAGAPLALARLLPSERDAPERAVALFRDGVLVAWAGPWRVRPDALAPARGAGGPNGAEPGAGGAPPNGSPDAGRAAATGVGITRTPFYLVLHASAVRGRWRAVAATLVSAAPPAAALASALDGPIAVRFGVRGFTHAAAGAPVDSGTWVDVGRGAGVSLRSRADVPGSAEASLRAVDEGRRRGAPALLAMTLVWVASVWRRAARAMGSYARRRRVLLARRLAALLVPAAVIAVAPLNALSNASRAFDATVYFSPVGGPFTASVGALGLSALLLVVALFTALRAGVRVPSRTAALALVLGLAWASPRLLRALSRGITPPAGGAPVWLYVLWQVALFLVAVAPLVAAIVAGRSTLGVGRGLPPLAAPALAAGAAIAGPLLWTAPAGWPPWYWTLWAGAVAALAFTRRTGGLLVAAVTVAGLGSATMVWSASARRRVELAEHDVRALMIPDREAVLLLERLGGALTDSAASTTFAGDGPSLLRAYAASALAAADYAVALAAWEVGDQGAPPRLTGRVATAGWRVDSIALGRLVGGPSGAGAVPVLRLVAAEGASALVLATPEARGRRLTVTLFPRTRLLPVDPLATLLGQRAAAEGEPPYALALQERPAEALAGAVGAPNRPSGGAPSVIRPPDDSGVPFDVDRPPMLLSPRWVRTGDALHADWTLDLPGGPARAHAEVELRGLDVLAPRGALLALLDLAIAGVLWALPTLGDGGWRSTRRRWRAAWLGSFRARLTLALFAFFAAPTLAFAVWSLRQLQAGDRQQREVLVRETLRAALAEGAAAATPDALAAAAVRVGAPLFAYDARGVLVAAAEPVLVELAPFGRLLPPVLAPLEGGEGEVTATPVLRVAGQPALVGFSSALAPGGARVVLAAPARTDELALDQRRRDLAFLVLLSAAGGGLAALWLSGLAARQLSRPVGALREAALALAGAPNGGSALRATAPNTVLAGEPPAEFRPVFAAFRRMATDLAASREALDAARRRTAAVLRDVASGVLAVDPEARVSLANPRAETLLDRLLPPGAPLDGRAPAPLVARVRAFVASQRPAGDEEAFDVEIGGRQLRGRLTRLGADPDGAAGAVLTLDDLTEIARAQRVLAWGEMARQVAHEIKNPLTPIRLGVQMLRRAHRDGRADFGTLLENNVERVLAEIDRLDEIARAFSRYGAAPDRRPAAEAVDVAAIARDVVALEELGQGAVAWALDGADAPTLAMARDGELREVLLNLLENARLARARRVTLRLARAPRDDGAPPAVVVSVGDDGDGIPAEVLPRIFEPHFSTRTSGSGLGLAITRRLVEAWGGAITAESEPGRGTTIAIRLRAAGVGANGDANGDASGRTYGNGSSDGSGDGNGDGS